MHAPEQSPSPRGIPAIRTDWLADVAWRLADHGLDALRGAAFAEARLTDVVDGQRWRLAAARLSEPWETGVEFDADLYLPSDEGPATMRAGFSLLPVYDEADGPATRVRVEIGPRGAVTFDPENWMLTIPAGAAKPPVARVEAGSWEAHGPQATTAAPADLADLADLTGLDLDLLDVPESGSASDACEVRLAAAPPAPPKGRLARLLGGGRRRRPAPVACLVVRAQGRITSSAQGDPAAFDALDRVSAVRAIAAHHDAVEISGAEGVLVLAGPRLRTEVQRFGGAPQA